MRQEKGEEGHYLAGMETGRQASSVAVMQTMLYGVKSPE